MPSKLEKFTELDTFPNCRSFFFSQLERGFTLRGAWKKEQFNNDHPIVLELGCGKGEYTIGLAEKHPEKNFIGVDLKGNRLWTGAKQALERNMQNVAFLRTRIDFIDHCFGPGEVDEIWITFPDPQPQKTRARQRLTHPIFLERYRKILKAGAVIHLKTDSTSLYQYSLDLVRELNYRLIWHSDHLYRDCPPEREELIRIKTYYEKLFSDKGENIKYLCFSLN
ncbi:MAG TPA: tRNA (guanosine(46)-N7)-methyltransferase TrmB [Bacteroidia bacterium]|nr:tRNA (guanosine(46)-N7)-methyltransferase TrmB [Bacteroidia bacterium]